MLILISAWSLLRRSAHILLEGTPEGIEPLLVAETVQRESGVRNVHHVHVWQLAGGRRMATLHAHLDPPMEAAGALASMQQVLRERFHIAHATIQIEEGDDCPEDDCHGHAPHRHPGERH
jgi:cobalt-zinc-cadmium efflux system protein